MFKRKFMKGFLEGSASTLYHMVVIALSSAIALSLPLIVRVIAKNFLAYWSVIGNEKIFLVSIEMSLAVLLILSSNYIWKSWKDRKLARMAKSAGLAYVTPGRGLLSRRKIRKLKEHQGFARDIMLLGSTGFRTFVDPKGDLHEVLRHCREAKIMLVNPYSEAANIRARSILDPNITLETFRDQINKSIEFLREIQDVKKNIKLKLYSDTPFLKLGILGDSIWLQYYHAGQDVQNMPEYLLKHEQNMGSLYIPFYQYFLTRWNSPDTPEYDFDTNELIYRDVVGNELRRETFNVIKIEVISNLDRDNNLVLRFDQQGENNLPAFNVGIGNFQKDSEMCS